MDTVYKLTTSDGYTRKGCVNACKWGSGVTHSGTGRGALCGPGYIHAYLSPLLAVMLNPIHANIENPRLWVCETVVVHSDNGLKVGGVSLTTKEETPLPVVSPTQRTAFAIYCAKIVFKDKRWNDWADRWLSGEDRTAESAESAARSAWSAARSAESAAWSARSAAWSAAESAAWSARSAWSAARSAESAARSAAWSAEILQSCAEKAILVKENKR